MWRLLVRAALVVPVISAAAAFVVPVPAAATIAPDAQIISMELVPVEGTTFTIGDRSYQGTIRVGAAEDGLVLTERVTLDQYLAGIREVPFSWPAETLAAQVVAARTYLAHTLAGGRSGTGARYGFDICATSACQVYAGTGLAQQPSGERWIAAVEATARQILMYEGRPAEAVYSSSAGSRTRPNQDIWGGAPIPYLQAVDSPEQGVTPFETWTIEVSPELFVSILRRDGHDVSGELQSVLERDPGEGRGMTTIWVDTSGGTVPIRETDLRGAFNRQGSQLAPGLLPVRTQSGRLPQAVPSYTYSITYDPGPAFPNRLRASLPGEDLPDDGVVQIVGEGWGHGVGLSQWGARAMGDLGATHQEILAHYYGGLEPVDGGEFVPEQLVVGLGWNLGRVEVSASGPFELRVNGLRAAVFPGGDWAFRSSIDGLAAVAPDELQSDLRAAIGGRQWPR